MCATTNLEDDEKDHKRTKKMMENMTNKSVVECNVWCTQLEPDQPQGTDPLIWKSLIG
jgi:hypothetical protein